MNRLFLSLAAGQPAGVPPRRWGGWSLLLFGMLLALPLHAAEPDAGTATAAEPEKRFATINGETIPLDTFLDRYRQMVKSRFYHGTPGENREEINDFILEVGDTLIRERLLQQQALREGIEPDERWVALELDKVEEQLEPATLERYGEELRHQSRVQQLVTRIKTIAPPSETALQAFYQANLDKFTTPAQFELSVILLKIDPSASSEVWENRKLEAASLRLLIVEGGNDFATLAKEHSDDPTAANGGRMGLQHQGVLGDTVEKLLLEMAVGEVSEPQFLLEGVALIRKDGQIDQQVNPLATVRERATGLWLREQSEAAYQRHLEEMVAGAEVVIVNKDYQAILDEQR